MQRGSRHRTGAVHLHQRLRCAPRDRTAAPGARELQLVRVDVELLPHSLGGGRAGRRLRLGSRVLRQAADAYDRAARPPYGRIPQPTPTGNRLRRAARIMSAFAYLTGDRSMTPIMLIAKLAALAEAGGQAAQQDGGGVGDLGGAGGGW